MRRQGLAPRPDPGTVEDAARATCGIHAQVMSAAELQGWSRCELPSRDAVARALWEDRSLVRTWCMRGTLQLLTPDQFGVHVDAFDAALAYGPVWFRAFEITPGEMERLMAALMETLDGRGLTKRELADGIGARLGSRYGERMRSGWGELLKPAARRGILVNGPSRGQEVTYVRADLWLGERERREPEAARAELVRRYLAAYGPASRDDYMRWLGLRAAGAVNRVFAMLEPELTAVQLSGRRLWALAADLDELRSGGDADLPVRLLPGFDPFLLGHADRDHLVSAELRPQIYRTAGWISPTVLARGVAAGTWEHRVEPGRLRVTVSPFAELSRADRTGVEAEAERLAAFFERDLELSFG